MQQHVDLYRKELLRKQLLAYAGEGVVYVPFCGDGDLAMKFYVDRVILAADLDPARVATFKERIPDADVRTGDCDRWLFSDRMDQIAIADFDAYAYPYDSFRSFWAQAHKAERLVMFFTDAQRQAIFRTGNFRLPTGERMRLVGKLEKGKYGNFWLKRYCEPWIREAVQPMKVAKTVGYLRDKMLYWGVVCES